MPYRRKPRESKFEPRREEFSFSPRAPKVPKPKVKRKSPVRRSVS